MSARDPYCVPDADGHIACPGCRLAAARAGIAAPIVSARSEAAVLRDLSMALASMLRSCPLRSDAAVVHVVADRPAAQNAPGHSHREPGVWDLDHREGRRGAACAWCIAWERAVRLVIDTAANADDAGDAEAAVAWKEAAASLRLLAERAEQADARITELLAGRSASTAARRWYVVEGRGAQRSDGLAYADPKLADATRQVCDERWPEHRPWRVVTLAEAP